jgi:hypothetical protein
MKKKLKSLMMPISYSHRSYKNPYTLGQTMMFWYLINQSLKINKKHRVIKTKNKKNSIDNWKKSRRWRRLRPLRSKRKNKSGLKRSNRKNKESRSWKRKERGWVRSLLKVLREVYSWCSENLLAMKGCREGS